MSKIFNNINKHFTFLNGDIVFLDSLTSFHNQIVSNESGQAVGGNRSKTKSKIKLNKRTVNKVLSLRTKKKLPIKAIADTVGLSIYMVNKILKGEH